MLFVFLPLEEERQGVLLGRQETLSTTKKVTVSSFGHCRAVTVSLFTGTSTTLFY